MRPRRPTSPGWRPLPGAEDRLPRRIGELLDGVTRKLGAPPAEALRAVFNQWPEIAGTVAAAHSRPLSVTRGVLVVAVDEPGWATSLRAVSSQLLRRVEEVAGPGVAERVEVRVRPRP